MDFKSALILLVGVCVSAFSVWSRMGRTKRSRWWVRTGWDRCFALMIAPAVGIFLVGIVLGSVVIDYSESLTVPFGLFLLSSGLLTLWGGLVQYIPRWFYPRWYLVNKGCVSPRRSSGR